MYTLDPNNAIANGGEKLVFFHPDNDNQLIKVINPRYINYMNTAWPISTRLRRLPHYWFYIKEVTEHVYSREANIPNMHFLQNITGLVDTNLGLGVSVEAVKKKNGELASSLAQIINAGEFSSVHDKALQDILIWVEDTYIIIRDLTTRNIVWDELNEHFVIIDGIGARHLPSLRSISRTYNRRSNRKRANKLRKRFANQLDKNKHNLINISESHISG